MFQVFAATPETMGPGEFDHVWRSLELFGWQDKGQQLLDMTRAGDCHCRA